MSDESSKPPGSEPSPVQSVAKDFVSPDLPPTDAEEVDGEEAASEGHSPTLLGKAIEGKSLRSSIISNGNKLSDSLGDWFEDVRRKITEQNLEINEFKDQLRLAQDKIPKTADSSNEINNLKKRITEGLNKLNTHYKTIRQIQEEDPEREWPILAFATTLEEDNDDSSRFDYDLVVSHLNPFVIQGDDKYFAPSDSDSQESLFSKPRTRGLTAISGYKKISRQDADDERRRLQEELASRDKVVERLHKKVLKMQAELARLCKEKQLQRFGSYNVNDECNDSVINAGADGDCDMFDNVNKRLRKMQKDIMNSDDSRDTYATTETDSEFRKRYIELLEEYAKKDAKIVKMQNQLDALTDTRKADEPATSILRRQLDESREEHESQKVIICEQAEQIEEYHQKYLESLQKTEELKYICKRLQMDNRKVEDQINLEIKQVKNKFEAKLGEFAQYPKLLENEQIKTERLVKEKQELERKLRLICVDFKKLRDEHEVRGSDEANGTECKNCAKLQDDLNSAQTQVHTLRKCYNTMTRKYDSVKAELDTLRKQSAKVISRMKGRSEEHHHKLQDHVHKLESDLAKTRAAYSVTTADKESTIKEMQGQLNCLAMCLDSSQKQIKSLKDHISCLNNGKTKSVVICCQADENNL